MKKNAFTLIELLVVIVIIGILATIGVAQFNNYAAKARDAKRVQDLAVIHKAFLAYYTEHETTFIPGTGWEGTGVGHMNRSSSDAANYQASIINGLRDAGYLSGGNFGETFKTTSNLDSYMFCHDDNGSSMAIFAQREDQADDLNINGVVYNYEGGDYENKTANDTLFLTEHIPCSLYYLNSTYKMNYILTQQF
jgi:prepilin-type N-terminal cleavage/methylation domain-containing protein